MASPAARSRLATRRVAIVAPSVGTVRRHWMPLLGQIIGRLHKVLLIAPACDGADAAKLADLGLEHVALPVTPDADRPGPARRMQADYRAALSDWRPHIVVAIGWRAIALAGMARDIERPGRLISVIPILDLPASGTPNLRHDAAEGLAASDAVVCHNRDHAKALLSVISEDASVKILPGAGIDLDAHAAAPLPSFSSGLVFLSSSTLERDRGVVDFAKAAALVKHRAPNTQFVLAGATGSGRLAVDPAALTQQGNIHFAGPVEDLRPALAACHVYVHTSRREGMPAAILSALAAGRPVVAVDGASAREAVDAGVNGALVPAGDSLALAGALTSFLKRPDLIAAQARASRLKAERRFDRRQVDAAMLDIFEL